MHTSNHVVCDTTAPDVLRMPRIETTDGNALAPFLTTHVRVSWHDVFADAESLVAKYEVCLMKAGSRCEEGEWVQAGLNMSAVLPIDFDLTGLPRLSATVKSYNRVGWFAVATTDDLDVDHWLPQVSRVSVEGFVRGEGEACTLNRTDNLKVAWESSDEGSGLFSHQVAVGLPEQSSTVVATATATERRATLYGAAAAAVGNATRVRFEVFATDGSAQSSSDYVDCTVDTGLPTVGKLWVKDSSGNDAYELTPSSHYAIEAGEEPFRRICWSGLSGSAGVERLEYWVSEDGAPTHLESPSTAYSNVVTDDATHLQVSVNDTCFDDASQLLDSAAYVLRIAAVNSAGLRGPATEITLVTDNTPPEATSGVTVYTGALSPTVQPSPCCLRFEFGHWIEEETRLDRYLICPRRNSTVDDCLDVGQATRLLIEDPEGCTSACLPPTNDSGWTSYQHAIGRATNHTNTSVLKFNFQVRAFNVLGQVGAGAPTSIEVETPTLAATVTFGSPSLQPPDESIAGTCALPLPSGEALVDAVHPADQTLFVNWAPEDPPEIGVDSPMPFYTLCVDGAAASCVEASATVGRANLGLLTPGVHVLNVTRMSIGGLSS